MAVATVIGGTGFLGREIVGALGEAGFAVRSASRRPPSGVQGGRVSHVAADVNDKVSLRRVFAGAAVVVNAVSLYVESGGTTFDEVHVRGAAAVARCAREAGVDVLVHVSGLGVRPDSPSAFVRARARGEQAVQETFAGSVVVRPSVMFGRHDSFLRSLERVTRMPLVPLFGKGEARLQPAYVRDVAAAVARLVAAGGPRAEVYELGGAEVLRYRQAVERVLDHLGRRRLLLPVPFPVWRTATAALSMLPSPPLTRDQLILMQSDNVVTAGSATFRDTGLTPAAFSSMLPHCLPRE